MEVGQDHMLQCKKWPGDSDGSNLCIRGGGALSLVILLSKWFQMH